MSNRFGTLFTLTSFGESHGAALGGVIDGCPAGIALDMAEIDREVQRRRPGQSRVTTSRNEADEVRFLSGILNGQTTGAPIGFVVENKSHRSADYDSMTQAFRPGHADYTYYKKYGGNSDIRGGGRSSARETVSRVVAGAVARQVLSKMYPDLRIAAYTKSVGEIKVQKPYTELDLSLIDSNPVRCPEQETAAKMETLILNVREQGDTIGGIVECVVSGCPVGVGEPVFGKLSSQLASAMMSINAAKGFEIGMGFEGCSKMGSEVIDNWVADENDARGVRTTANNSGGIQGGISNGEDIVFRVAFKPVATLLRAVETVDRDCRPTTLKVQGRHDPCVVPRAVPIVESMAAMVLLDLILQDRARRL